MCYLLSQYLVDGGALLEGALGHHLGALLLHEEHEGVQGLLDVRRLLLLLLGAAGGTALILLLVMMVPVAVQRGEGAGGGEIAPAHTRDREGYKRIGQE